MFLRAVLMAIAFAVPLAAQDVDGRVLEDTSGDPLVNAELRFHKAGMHELAADLETDRDGRFHAAGIPAGEYTVDVLKPNHITTILKLQVPSSGLLVRLVRYAVIAGTVRDTSGNPLPGRVLIPTGRASGSARIAVLLKQAGTDELKAVRQVPLSDGGRYRIFDLPPGQYAVGLWWGGLPVGSGAQMYPDNAHPRFFDVAGGEDYRDIDFLVTPGASFSVSGRIESTAAGMQFAIALALPELPALPVAQLWSEEDGTFRVERIPPGTYDLLVAGPARGYGAFDTVLGENAVYGRTRIQVIGENLEGISVPLSAGRTLDVVLHGAKDACPKAIPVGLTLLEPWGLMVHNSVEANFEKPQTVRDLAPARYALAATGLGAGCYQVNRPIVDLSRDSGGPVAIGLGQAGAIRGTLRAGAANAKDFAVLLLNAEAGESSAAQVAFPDEHGRFEFAGLRPGRYRMAAQLAAGGAKVRWVADIARTVEIDVPGGAPTEVELPVSKGGAQ
jgi:hypothetical protein